MKTIGLICATGLEAEPLLPFLSSMAELGIGRFPAWRGRLADVEVMLVAGGMGKTNAAHAATLLMETQAPARLVGFGVGGAYPGSGASVGSIVLADAEIYGDEGVDTPDGWFPTDEIGIPLLETERERLFNRFPVDSQTLEIAVGSLTRAGQHPIVGTFVTVSCCSGQADRGLELAARHSAVCETMEGAAYAHVAAIYGAPFLEVRGISNLVEDRDLRRWKLAEAAETSARAVATIVGAVGTL